MKTRSWLAALVALAIALPGALGAQDRRDDEPRVGGGYMGILFGWDDRGTATVRDVVPESPADRAGVRRGDVVVRLNGRAPTEDAVDDLRERLERGDTVRLVLRRDGREEQRTVIAAERRERIAARAPDDLRGRVFTIPRDRGTVVIRMDTLQMHVDSMLRRVDSLRVRLRRQHGDSIVIRYDTVARVLRDSLLRVLPTIEGRMREGVRPFFMEFGMRSMAGAEFAEVNPGLGRYFRTDHGLLVLQVAPETPAARAGVQAGDVVVEANGTRVARVEDLRTAFTRADGQEVRLTLLRDGRRQQVSVRWDAYRGLRYRLEGDAQRVRVERVRPSPRPRN